MQGRARRGGGSGARQEGWISVNGAPAARAHHIKRRRAQPRRRRLLPDAPAVQQVQHLGGKLPQVAPVLQGAGGGEQGQGQCCALRCGLGQVQAWVDARVQLLCMQQGH